MDLSDQLGFEKKSGTVMIIMIGSSANETSSFFHTPNM